MKNTFSRLSAFILCFVILLTGLPLYAAADEIQPVETAVSSQDTGNALSWFMGQLGTAALKSTVSFGVSKLLNEIFPSNSYSEQFDEINEKLDVISGLLGKSLQNQEYIIDKLTGIQDFLEGNQYAEILNGYNSIKNRSAVFIPVYSSVTDTDELSDLSERRISLLTDEMGITDCRSVLTDIDRLRSDLYQYITTLHYVNVGGTLRQLNLFEIYREYIRSTCDWENMAAGSINEFNSSIVRDYLFLSTLDIFSVYARQERIKQHNADNPGNIWYDTALCRLRDETIPAEAENLLEMYVENCIDLPDNLMHFWKGGSDLWFFRNILSTEIGEESMRLKSDYFTRLGLLMDFGVNFMSSIGFAGRTVNRSFFEGMYTKNQPENAELLKTDTLNQLLAAYDNRKTAGEILAQSGAQYTGTLDHLLINYDDSKNPFGTYRSKIIYAESKMGIDVDDTVAYACCINTGTKNAVAAGGAERCDIYYYIEASQVPATSTCNTMVVYNEGGTLSLDMADRLFEYTGDEYCAHSMFTQLRNAEAGSCTVHGYSGDTYCMKCGKLVSEGEDTGLRHEYEGEGDDVFCRLCQYPVSGKNGVYIDRDNLVISGIAAGTAVSDALSFLELDPDKGAAVYSAADELLFTGKTVTVKYGQYTVGNFRFAVSGDLNGDAVCDVLDASLTERALNGHLSLDVLQNYAANNTSGGEISAEDFQNIVNMALN